MLALFFLQTLPNQKCFRGFILPLNGRTNSSEGNYILHITVKNYVYFILFLHQKYCDKTVFSLQSLFAKIALKMLLIFLSEDSVISSMFSLSLSLFFASCANFRKTASIWIFYDCSSVIWVILSTKDIRDIHFGYWLRERRACYLHKGNSIL